MPPLAEDRHRSPFLFAMLFAHLLPPDRVSRMLDDYVAQCRSNLEQISTHECDANLPGERFVMGMGRMFYTTVLDYIATRRGELETRRAEAAE